MKAEAIYQHPERVKLEMIHRKTGDASNYDAFAGPYDITIIKLDTQVNFNSVVIIH